MKPQRGTSDLIQAMYPGREHLVSRGLSEHPAFLELCDDYRRCFVMLESLKAQGPGTHPELVSEYEDLLAELGREVEGWLEDLVQGRV